MTEMLNSSRYLKRVGWLQKHIYDVLFLFSASFFLLKILLVRFYVVVQEKIS